jgi:Xaa-Pro aminopeptidase
MAKPSELPQFGREEFETRVERARSLMRRNRLDGIVVTSEANIEYLSGFVTQFAWVTPSRPWYFVLPSEGDATAIIPEIGETNWASTSWCRNVQTWPSPRPEDEGLVQLAAVLTAISRRFGRVGFEVGPESRLGMTVSDFGRLREMLPALEFADSTPVTTHIRATKSAAEIDKIRRACQVAGQAFSNLRATVSAGDTEREIHRRFSADLLLKGADNVPYASIGSGAGGYASIVMGPTDRQLVAGDIFMIDTGARYQGYFCDFDRNFSLGEPSEAVRRINAILWSATEAGISAAIPGNTAADVFRAQANVIEGAGLQIGNVGRFGHGLGKLITEFPSVAPNDTTALRPGMVLTIEPSASFSGGIMAHEEDLVVTEDRPELLTERAPREIEVIN